jgi:hypothetical protein
VRDLLSHRSGLGTYSGDLLSYGTPYTAEEVVRRARYLPPAFSFRDGARGGRGARAAGAARGDTRGRRGGNRCPRPGRHEAAGTDPGSPCLPVGPLLPAPTTTGRPQPYARTRPV